MKSISLTKLLNTVIVKSQPAYPSFSDNWYYWLIAIYFSVLYLLAAGEKKVSLFNLSLGCAFFHREGSAVEGTLTYRVKAYLPELYDDELWLSSSWWIATLYDDEPTSLHLLDDTPNVSLNLIDTTRKCGRRENFFQCQSFCKEEICFAFEYEQPNAMCAYKSSHLSGSSLKVTKTATRQHKPLLIPTLKVIIIDCLQCFSLIAQSDWLKMKSDILERLSLFPQINWRRCRWWMEIEARNYFRYHHKVWWFDSLCQCLQKKSQLGRSSP